MIKLHFTRRAGIRTIRFLIITLFFLQLSTLLFAQQRYSIASVSYRTDGPTRSSALDQFLNWDHLEIFDSIYDLDAYIQEKEKLLINRKLYKSVRISYNSGAADSPVVPVYITVTIEESWTILPLPIYMYDDNLGMMTGVDT